MWLLTLQVLLIFGTSSRLLVHGEGEQVDSTTTEVSSTVPSEAVNQTEIICANITCIEPPPNLNCSQRSALTIAATAAYGEKRICCPLWSCLLPNGTTSLHYAEEGKNETCAGIVCLPGSPSTNCRRSSAPEITQGLMSVALDCCPIWTCTFPSNGSLYYVHAGVTSLTRYWASSIKKFELPFMSLDEDPLASLPVSSTTETPRGLLEKKSVDNTSELLLQVFKGQMEITELEGVREDGWCEGVACYPSRAPSCVPAPDPTNNLSDILGLRKACCPLYACKTNTDRFLLFSFGMFYSENITTTTIDTSMFSVTPIPLSVLSSTAITVAPSTALTTTSTTTEVPSTKAVTTQNPSTTLLTTTETPAETTTKTPSKEESDKADDQEEEEKGDPQLEMSTNPAESCYSMKCYPAPDREKCVPSPPTDCNLRLMLASALACCPSYKCSYSSGLIFQFGITDGVTHTVIASPMNQTNDKDNKPGSCPPLPSSDEVKKIEYVDDCDSVNKCLRPRGVRLGDCEKLSEGKGVPRPLREAGVTRPCCGVWKCDSNAGYKELYQFGVIFHDETTYIPFEFDGPETARKSLPTDISDLENTPATPSTCPDLNCGPPFAGAACKPAEGSVSRRIKSSLRRKSLCCPIWECNRGNTVLYIYGHMFSTGHANVTFKSIFSSDFFPKKEEDDEPKFKVSFEVKKKTTTSATTSAPNLNTFKIELVEEETATARHSLGKLQMPKSKNNKKSNKKEKAAAAASASSSSSSSSEEEEDKNKTKKKKKGGTVMKQSNKQQLSVMVHNK